MYKYLIKFLVLVSASLSLHSALALPLSSLLESKYHAFSQSNKTTKQFDNDITLKEFNKQHSSQLTLVNKLPLFLKEKHSKNLFFHARLSEIITLAILQNQQVTQYQVKHYYQLQCNAHLDILAYQNTLYSKKNCYQAKLQQQRAS